MIKVNDIKNLDNDKVNNQEKINSREMTCQQDNQEEPFNSFAYQFERSNMFRKS